VPLKLKVFGPYGLMPRVSKKLENDVNKWAEAARVEVKDIKAVTASLPDRTMILLLFYSTEEAQQA
jgi:hypothetical protein